LESLLRTIAIRDACLFVKAVEGCIEPRGMLNLTVMFDHDVVDRAPATRFTGRLVELIESGYGLDETDCG
jgi:pyruvate/2-oxoglutarate dehydrogenase complex dihydrolipoamide acyltransferase (E2) component